MKFHKGILDLDPAAESNLIIAALREKVPKLMRRYGAVVGISGGVDSAVVLALCVKAFGPEKVLAIMMPDKDSESDSENLARQVSAHYEVQPICENITSALEGFGCYLRRDQAIRRALPAFDAAQGHKVKIGLPQNLLEEDTLNVFSVTMVGSSGTETTRILAAREFLDIVAASNLKQRTRMSILYYHAERNNYAVIGTTNKNEHGQGFFVKHGDGGVDIQAIAHLYKTQVYQLAEFLGVPDAIRNRPPTTDTYSASGTQQEFFFRLPFETMDLLWFAQENAVSVHEVAQVMGLTEIQIQRAFRDFSRKQRMTTYLRMAPVHLDVVAKTSLPEPSN
jgi:NAD+ synthase